MSKNASPKIPNRKQVLGILDRFRTAQTDRDKHKVVVAVRREGYPGIAARLAELIVKQGDA